MRVELEVRSALLLLGVVLLVVSTGSIVAAQLVDTGEPAGPEAELVTLDDGSELWPYTSRSTSVDERTLSINLVIYGDKQLVHWVLRDDPFRDWEEVDEERQDVAPVEDPEEDYNESALAWGGAAGANRWIWVDPPGGEPRWVAEAYQLEDGDYLGQRHHIRAYEDPNASSWTALQAHTEHWDWFHLRHTVHSIEDTQLFVEEDILGRWFVEDLSRERFGNHRSADADGWVTVVYLDGESVAASVGILALALVGTRTVSRREIRDGLAEEPMAETGLRALAAVAAIVLAYHAIRFGAIGAERWIAYAAPKLIVAVGYPILVVGMPVVAYLTTRRLDATMAFSAAALAFVIATFLDYSYLGVSLIPLETFVHRGALAMAVGLIAAGASETARDPDARRGFVRTGVLLWLVALLVPLLQFI